MRRRAVGIVARCGLLVACVAVLEAGGAATASRADPAAAGGSGPATARRVGPTMASAAAPLPTSAQELPDGVTPRTISSGASIFRGRGLCYTCHGEDGRGIAQLGADLRDREWVHTDGSYAGIVEVVRTGVSAENSTSGIPMPPRGGSSISPEEVRAVAAYVWSLSHDAGSRAAAGPRR